VNNRLLRALLAVVVLTGASRLATGADEGHKHAFDKCAKACADCMLECESCARHCAEMVSKGNTRHFKTLGTCADCGDFCALAAKVTSRQGPTAATTCEACAKVCDVCGAACEEFKEDEHMKRCAKACRVCARECREMVKHAGHHEPTKEKAKESK